MTDSLSLSSLSLSFLIFHLFIAWMIWKSTKNGCIATLMCWFTHLGRAKTPKLLFDSIVSWRHHSPHHYVLGLVSAEVLSIMFIRSIKVSSLCWQDSLYLHGKTNKPMQRATVSEAVHAAHRPVLASRFLHCGQSEQAGCCCWLCGTEGWRRTSKTPNSRQYCTVLWKLRKQDKNVHNYCKVGICTLPLSTTGCKALWIACGMIKQTCVSSNLKLHL